MPGIGNKPIGGFKVIYEQANRLVLDNFVVYIVYPAGTFFEKRKTRGKLGCIYRLFRGKLFQKFSTPYKWFQLDKRIKQHLVWSLSEKYIPKCNIICATGIETSIYLNKYKKNNIKKLYYIQDFENWDCTNDQVLETYRFQMTKIAIAPWLVEKISEAGESCILIPNGFDFSFFELKIPILTRTPYSICMLYHKDERKRCSDAISALIMVKTHFPQLSVKIFGTSVRGNDIPEWFEYFRLPDRETHNHIYNDSAIFIAASSQEGFGLTVGEAMICGCAVACTDNGGFSMMVKHNETGLISPVFDIQALADNIMTLITDHEKRIKLAESGNTYIHQFTWDKAYKSFKEVLQILNWNNKYENIY
jgi:glycosyltransferase involved in cell wall biosynthesis